MRVFRETFLRLFILLVAVGLPLFGAFLVSGPPSSLDVEELDRWSPIQKPGPSASLLSQGVTSLVVGDGQVPEWFDAENQELLAKASAALEADKLKEALGHVFTLSAQLEDKGRTLEDFLPIVMPEVASWMVANYFAPVLLGTLFVALVLLVFGPWLVRRFYDFLKLVSTLVIGLIGVGFAASLCFAIAKQKALVFGLIEYLVVVAALLSVGNLLMFWSERKRAKAGGTANTGEDEKKRAPSIALVANREPPASRLETPSRPALRASRPDEDAVPVPVAAADGGTPASRPLVAPLRTA